MALSTDQKNRISEVIKEILLRRIENFPELGAQVRNAPFHSAFLDCFNNKLAPLNVEIPYLVAIASWLHGLNTSLGSGFESIAHILSGGYKRKFAGVYKLKVQSNQASSIENIIRDLKSINYQPNLSRENKLIFETREGNDLVDSLDFTVDAYMERNNEIVAIELKSVRPNSGEGRGEKQKMLYAKAALKLLNPNKEIKYFVGFPFDPTSSDATGYDKNRFFNYLIEFKKFFAEDEVLIAGELWDYLSGSKNTMEQILEVIKNTVSSIRNS